MDTAVDIDDMTAEHHRTNEDAPAMAGSRNEREALSHIGNRVPLPWRAIGPSPASTFAIDCDMRIVSWARAFCVVVGSCGIVVLPSGNYGTVTSPWLWFLNGAACIYLLSQRCVPIYVPLIGDPRDLFLEALSFVHARARDQYRSAIRRAFDATAEQENVQIMVNLATLNGPVLLAMVANVGRTDSSVLAILTGREVDSSLAGLLHIPEPVTESDVGDIRVQLDRSDADASSITLPSDSPLLVGGHGGGGHQGFESSNSATSRSVDEERIGPQYEARMVLRLQQDRAEDRLHWGSDPVESVTRIRESCFGYELHGLKQLTIP